MSHLTRVIALDGAECLKVYNKFRYISRCLSSTKSIDLASSKTRHHSYPKGQAQQASNAGSLLVSQSAQRRPVLLLRQPVRFYSDLPPHTVITLPALSPTMESGSIVAWDKQEGDEIAEGDVLCEVETDKATMGFEASEPGILAKILVPAGTKGLALGSPVCIVVSTKEQVAAFASYKAAAGAPAAAAAAPAPSSGAAPAAPAASPAAKSSTSPGS